MREFVVILPEAPNKNAFALFEDTFLCGMLKSMIFF